MAVAAPALRLDRGNDGEQEWRLLFLLSVSVEVHDGEQTWDFALHPGRNR
jgi:hypothetical protein